MNYFIKSFNVKRKLRAFTLAETLIVLAIIGVVAALTIPTLLAKKQRLDLQAGFKSTYSIVSNAYAVMAHEQDVDSYCPTEDVDQGVFVNDFVNYVKHISYATDGTQNLLNLKLTTGYDLGYKVNRFKNPHGVIELDSNLYNDGYILLNNGAVIFNGGCVASALVHLTIDTNGAKGPNRTGYDVFVLPLKNGKIALDGTFSGFNHGGALPEDKVKAEYCKFSAESDVWNYGSNGATCAYWALIGKYPENQAKSYWSSLP